MEAFLTVLLVAALAACCGLPLLLLGVASLLKRTRGQRSESWTASEQRGLRPNNWQDILRDLKRQEDEQHIERR